VGEAATTLRALESAEKDSAAAMERLETCARTFWLLSAVVKERPRSAAVSRRPCGCCQSAAGTLTHAHTSTPSHPHLQLHVQFVKGGASFLDTFSRSVPLWGAALALHREEFTGMVRRQGVLGSGDLLLGISTGRSSPCTSRGPSLFGD
jgi:hypothetical protein